MKTKVSKDLNNCRVHLSYAKRYKEREELLEKLYKCYDIEVLRSFVEQEWLIARDRRLKEEALAEIYKSELLRG